MKPALKFRFRWALGVALALGALSFLASQKPDGLEKVGEELGFSQRAQEAFARRGWMPDYHFPGIPDERWATGLAGVAGVLLVYAAAVILAHWLSRGKGAPR